MAVDFVRATKYFLMWDFIKGFGLAMKYFFKAYASDAALRAIIDDKRFGELNVNPAFGVGDLRAVPPEWRDGIPEYVKDYVPLNQFM